ncbi:RHS repeat-associated core domain-containing protein [Chromobacterium sp. CV08]|uniref:RHS repeat-associated core domain-containing protein n=1 Tax=Chromobacterium sp. CV08 TaxID=3133274 RepID=UPI003DA8021C
MNEWTMGYDGERLDPVGGMYLPGRGARGYRPALMRFAGPDALSPFGAGGVNPYAYCDGDPVNRADPSGHFSVGGAVGIGLGVLGVLLTPLSFGTTLAAALSIGAVVAGVASVGLGIAAEMVDDRGLADKLGWTSLAAGVVGCVAAIGVGRLAFRAEALFGAASSRLPGSAVQGGGGVFGRSLLARLGARFRPGAGREAAAIGIGEMRRASSTPDMAAFLALPEQERTWLAQGSQGVVYDVSEHWVAKAPIPGAGSPRSVDALRREADIFRKVYGAESARVEHGMLWMRKVPGRRVQELPRSEYRRIEGRIVAEWRRLERIGIHYRDLNGENVLVDHDGVVRFVDFGMATLRAD